MLASDITSRARIILQDADGVRWADSELLKWISDGQRVIAVVRPDASSANYTHTLAAGSKQTLPANGSRLLDVVRNVSNAGAPGRAVRIVDRETLDAQNPSWHTATPTGTIYNFTYDNRDPLNFYVYPPSNAGQKLDIIYSVIPSEVQSTGATLALLDLYAEPLLNYVLFRAYSKDAEFGSNAGLAQGYFQVFMSLLGLKTSKDFAFSPEANKPGGTVNAVAVQAGGV